ncbi:MAG: hypothetical protein ACI379_10120 [Nocardioides sp.]|uniref:hypothetical protein n=1 Tax=Nocardioides sp. TaxID=35761 RepID=UPI003F006065
MVAERMRTLEDSSALTGDSIDVAARVAWTLRMARVTSPDDVDSRLRSLADQLGSSPAHLSRVETGQRRDGELVDGYEWALGLPAGSLRGPIEVLCRGFASQSPRDLSPGRVVTDVHEMSRLTGTVLGDGPVSGGDWMRWAGALSQPGNIGLPEESARHAVRRLVAEMGRSVGHAYPSRYEALSRLRCSGYGHLLVEVAREVLAEPYAAGTLDLMSAIGEARSEGVEEWFVGLLRSGDDRLVLAGALGLENLGEIAGAEVWADVLEALVEAFDSSTPGSSQAEWTAHLLRLVPRAVLQERTCRPSRPLPAAPDIGEVDESGANALWSRCLESARRVSTVLDLPTQPMLARLLFDVAYCPWESRAVTGYMLLDALPALTPLLGAEVHHLYESAPSPGLQRRLVRRWARSPYAQDAAERGGWLGSEDPVVRSGALQAAGAAGVHLPMPDLVAALDDPQTRIAAIYSIGMSGHPLLRGGLDSEALSSTSPSLARAGLAWWLANGARVTL